MLKIFCVEMDEELNQQQYEILLDKIDNKKKSKINKYKFYKDSLRSLIGDLLVRYCIKEFYDLNNSEISYGYNDYGKPFLKGYKNICFNISHSGRWIVCAISDDEVGIDVECINDIDINIFKNFFTEEEFIDLMSLKEEEYLEYFFRIWTMKEAYIKGDGKGLSIPLDSFCIKRNHECFFVDNDKTWTLHCVSIGEGYCLSVASKSHRTPDIMQKFKLKKFAEMVIETL